MALEEDVSFTIGPIASLFSSSPIFIDLQLLGSCFSSLTCGLLLSWAARYWALGYRDEWYLKAAVGIGSLYALIDTALNCSWAYRWAVSFYISPAQLEILPWQLTAFCFSLGGTAWLVQNFYLVRLFFLSRRNWLLCTPIALVITGCLGLSLYMGYYCSQHSDSLIAFQHLSYYVTGWMAGSLATDLFTLGGILYYMQRNRREPFLFRNIDWSQIPRKIMQTNTPSTLYQLAIVILNARYPKTLRFTYLGFCSSKVYLGTFIATCTARDPHGSLSFDEMLDTRRLKGLGPGTLPPVRVAVEQERRVEGGSGADEIISGGTFDSVRNEADLSAEARCRKDGMPRTSSYGMTQFRVDFDATRTTTRYGDHLGTGEKNSF
ncbi:hypothetical protein JCM8202v2_006290 [Rhodotorula sphaerocarpa]